MTLVMDELGRLLSQPVRPVAGATWEE